MNYLAGYLLTSELLPLLERSAPARIVNVSSAGQLPIDFDDVMLEHGYSGVRAYCQSKLAQILFTVDLAERLPDGVTVTALHPATYMPTKIVAPPASPVEEGVEATLRLVTDPQLEGVSGAYFNGLREQEADSQAYDADARGRLRELSERLTAGWTRGQGRMGVGPGSRSHGRRGGGGEGGADAGPRPNRLSPFTPRGHRGGPAGTDPLRAHQRRPATTPTAALTIHPTPPS